MKFNTALLTTCMMVIAAIPANPVTAQSPLIGRTVSAPDLVDEHGRDAKVIYRSRPTVLFVVSNGCEWCERSAPSVALLASRRKAEYRFIGVSLKPSGIPTFSKLLPFPVYAVRDLRHPRWHEQEYAIGVTPSLIVVSAESKILQVWYGPIRTSNKSAVEKYFGVQLPDLTDGH